MTICRQRSTFFASGDREQSHIATEQEQQQPNSIFKHFALFAFCHFFFFSSSNKSLFSSVINMQPTHTHMLKVGHTDLETMLSLLPAAAGN